MKGLYILYLLILFLSLRMDKETGMDCVKDAPKPWIRFGCNRAYHFRQFFLCTLRALPSHMVGSRMAIPPRAFPQTDPKNKYRFQKWIALVSTTNERPRPLSFSVVPGRRVLALPCFQVQLQVGIFLSTFSSFLKPRNPRCNNRK